MDAPIIKNLPVTQLVGMHVTMSVAENKTGLLWKQFMPRRMEVKDVAGPEFYSLEVYPSTDYFSAFDPTRHYQKWAALRVSNAEEIPEGMEVLSIPAGRYAVFTYRGKASDGAAAYQYMYGTWLPNSGYELDDRPHMAVMGDKYKGDDPDSEEELWVPIKG